MARKKLYPPPMTAGAHLGVVAWEALLESRRGRKCQRCGKRIPVGRSPQTLYCYACVFRSRSVQNSELRAYIITRDRSICHLCRKPCLPDEIHLDHLIPQSLGGPDTKENLRVAHASCNLRKRAKACNEQLLLIG